MAASLGSSVGLGAAELLGGGESEPVTSKSESDSDAASEAALSGGLGGRDAVSGRMELMLNEDLSGVRAMAGYRMRSLLMVTPSIFTMILACPHCSALFLRSRSLHCF